MRINISKTIVLLTVFFLLGLHVLSAAQSSDVFSLTAEDLQKDKQIALDKLQWKYQTGDDVRWANPEFDDASWETLNGTILTLDDLPKSGWNGIGWFRLRLKVDESLTNQQLALIIDHWGASEVYVDGKLINKFGKVGASAETEEAFKPNGSPVTFEFSGNQNEHLIVVRHSVMALRDPSLPWSRWLGQRADKETGNSAGVEISVGKPAQIVLGFEEYLKSDTGNLFGRGGMLLMIGLLFLLLYLFYPSRRVNLYFSIFALVHLLGNINGFLYRTHYDLAVFALNRVVDNCGWAGSNIFLLVFLYATFAERIPKYFWVFVAAYVVELFLDGFFLGSAVELSLHIALLLFVSFESIRIMIAALVKRKSGAWIVGIGAVMFATLQLFNALQITNSLLGTNLLPPPWIFFLILVISTFGVTIPIAIYLAREFAQTNKNLETQLVKEVEQQRVASQFALEREQEKARFAIVEAENERRAKELEEARHLQLSMLPKKLPVIPNLEIAAYMKPATEVGGDYYDFHEGFDGTLTVAVGDATGHGLKAGTLVSTTKGLFNAFANEPDISQIFTRISGALKRMNLRGLFMAMTMLKVKDNQISLSIAGMPSVLIYRRETETVEEIAVRAMPLGSVAKTVYRQQQIKLAKDDVVVLMSDGFPEMFNPENEMLGFDKAAEILPNIAANSAQEIINELVKVGEDWAGTRPQDDDVTFVVLKVRTEKPSEILVES